VFIVDEASMISDDKAFGENGLLQDLVEYVFEKGSNRLLLVGDMAQLPPVGQALSPSLNPDYMQHTLGCDVSQIELRQVMRQGQESGILLNATNLRNELVNKEPKPAFSTKLFKDIYRMTGERLEDGLRYAYNKYGTEDTVVICRSNKNANLYNQHIRTQIHFTESEIGVGDLIMIVKNNYFWLPKESGAGFLANGDFAEITKIISFEEMYGFRFATVRLKLVDFPEVQELDVKIMLDTLHSPSPALPPADNNKLYAEVLKDYEDLKTKKERSAALKNNPYLNALQVKFAYAITCHKAQGGQWKAVFVDHGYLKDEPVNDELVRWLYTAITRASEELFLVNFNPQFVAD
ncbi:MAG: ATP-dependent endonuclease, partial [Flavobacterium sp.]